MVIFFAYSRDNAADTFDVCAALCMTTALIISLRESFETALIVCVILAFLKRTEAGSYYRWVWAGLGA